VAARTELFAVERALSFMDSQPSNARRDNLPKSDSTINTHGRVKTPDNRFLHGGKAGKLVEFERGCQPRPQCRKLTKPTMFVSFGKLQSWVLKAASQNSPMAEMYIQFQFESARASKVERCPRSIFEWMFNI
jgi:hypothetical protein